MWENCRFVMYCLFSNAERGTLAIILPITRVRYSLAMYCIQSCALLNLRNPVPVRLHSGNGKLKFVIFSPFFAIFTIVVHSLEPGETPSYSASHQSPNYAQRS